MRYPLKLDKNRIQIFHEGHKRRLFVGELIYDPKKDKYSLIYDRHYTHAKNAIPLGPDLSLFKLKHDSQKGKMFPIFLDRIPDKLNPAYADYCASQNISPDEKNIMVLLGTIGRRGPSSFVFEPVYSSDFSVNDIAKYREQLSISQHDFALAFDISQVTLQRIESGNSADLNTLKRIEMLLTFPDVALWQLKQTGNRIHKNALIKLKKYFS
ncbi:MAG: hypothetical protein A3I77_06790 [Gammaproteobacteria bacterium RIFCSPLOWO2_02_FULL_42_14]|nr:MAG: hypothetical protein A3B71_02625 [Gammaproteobacteria bacterium RIFCSPHIGHO2_02_FULL_42_43]OGT28003.1 MAG: hypothetical protein A2624_03940 [Gammaproteobacteria bacterium RIFCSPHIGHO2_01_FULL_42_8]OGT51967.1 MAG: hypothetical protein A3E54_04130 [Gammaproteobacteria bacterium RIFCSPHIGHO2_12_FULL_41_25]OGT61072.1 MAG: hypothetical protein A3I77_06790 [Gammaproteobacteria bacterium RIFCSPLOWO2_02_FULL_42_14]OGT87000.1 MAG: hypothetical protein A3G86_00510 [Gammaproteobacteria bacterium R